MILLWSALLLVLGLQGVALAPTVWAESRGARLEGQKAVAGKNQANDKPLAEFVAAQTGKSWAVVIGINEYQDPTVRRLKYAVADARAMAQELDRRGYHVTLLLNEQATARAINTELRSKLRQRVGKNDRVVIYYAGHGLDDKVAGSRTMGYLLPVDGEKENVPGTGISMGVVKEMSDALPAKHVLFLIDACYGGVAGQLFRSLTKVSEAYVRQITRERGRQLITAGGADQEALEASDDGHGLFTTYLLKGLAEGLADTNQDGVIPASELYAYVESRVSREAHLQRHEQRPEFWTLSAEKGELVFFTGKSQADPSAASTSAEMGSTAPDELAKMKAELAALKEQMAQATNTPKTVEPPKVEVPSKATQLTQVADALKTGESQKVEAPSMLMQLARVFGLSQGGGREIVSKDGAPMVLIPAGEFMMGSPDNEGNNDEHPVHPVYLDAYYLDQYEVTTALYAQFMKATNRIQPAHWSVTVTSAHGNKPVVGVDWADATAYCSWLEKRLPTEAEWEKAARGTDQRQYPWGNDAPNAQRANSDHRTDFSSYGVLTDVGRYEAGKSPYGIYDMAGNVEEWVADWYGADYYTKSPVQNPRGPLSGKYRVRRGGSWLYIPALVRAANRDWVVPTTRGANGGFRCAQDVPK